MRQGPHGEALSAVFDASFQARVQDGTEADQFAVRLKSAMLRVKEGISVVEGVEVDLSDFLLRRSHAVLFSVIVHFLRHLADFLRQQGRLLLAVEVAQVVGHALLVGNLAGVSRLNQRLGRVLGHYL